MTPEQVARLTPDQAYFRLCQPDVLKRFAGGRQQKIVASGAASIASRDGMVKVRTADGRLVEMPAVSNGKSIVQQLREKHRGSPSGN